MEKKQLNTIDNPIETAICDALIMRVNQFKKTIKKSKFTHKKLYESGKTGALLKERKTNLGAFKRTMSRMNAGIGLFHDPVLLSAILEDTNYPVQVLFGDNSIQTVNMDLLLGEKTVDVLERIISQAVLNASKPVVKNANFEKRLIAAGNIFKTASCLLTSNNFIFAFFMLYFNYSHLNSQLYNHFKDEKLSHINKIIPCFFNYNSDSIKSNFGKLLTFSYIIFEITRIYKTLIRYNDKKDDFLFNNRIKYSGFFFQDAEYRNSLESNLKIINDTLKELTDNAINKSNILFPENNSFIIKANFLLYRMLPETYTDYSMIQYFIENNKDMYLLNKLIGTQDIKQKKTCVIDKTFITDIEDIAKTLIEIKNQNETTKEKAKSIFGSGNGEDDEIDDTADDDIDEEKDEAEKKPQKAKLIEKDGVVYIVNGVSKFRTKKK